MYAPFFDQTHVTGVVLVKKPFPRIRLLWI
jgi:hypothetical protein